MFWSDPNLYGATFPYKDVQATMPWGPIPRYLPQNYPQTYPQTYGFLPPFFGMQPPINPFMQPPVTPFMQSPVTPFMQSPVNPFLQAPITPFMREGVLPFLKPELAPPVGPNPYLLQYNQPIVPWFRPFHF